MKDKKIYVFTNADLKSGLGDFALIERRAKAFKEVFGFKTVCFCLRNKCNSNTDYLTFCECNFKDFISRIIIENPDVILLYGVKTLLKIPYLLKIRKKNVLKSKLLLDIQGCLEERIDFSPTFINKIKYFLSKTICKNAFKKVDGFFVTSFFLIDYIKDIANSNLDNKNFYLVRCGTTFKLNIDEMKKIRNKAREDFSIKKDLHLYLYSGGNQAWQNLDKIVKIFSLIKANDPKSFFILLTSKNDSLVKELNEKVGYGHYKIMFLNNNEYMKALLMSDAGFIFRDYKMTNFVAFPNKFSDYISCGLIPCINKAIKDPISLLKDFNFPYFDLEEDDINKLIFLVSKRIDNIDDFYNTCINFSEKYLSYNKQVKLINLDI